MNLQIWYNGNIGKNIMNAKKYYIVLVFLVLSGISGYYFLNEKQTPLVRKSVRIGFARQSTNALGFVAQDKGYFSDEGLDVVVKEYSSGKLALEGMLAGETDIALGVGSVPVTSVATRGVDLEIISGLSSTDNYQRIIARRDRGITRPEDLKGKRIATQELSDVHFFLSIFLEKYGLSQKDVSLSFVPPDLLTGALSDGDIDAISMREPFISQAEALLSDNAIIFDAPGLILTKEYVVASRSFVTKEYNQETVRRLLRALIRAEEFIKQNQGESIVIVSTKLMVEEKVVRAIWSNFHFAVSLDQTIFILLEDVTRWLVGNNYAGADSDPNYLNFIYSDALKMVKSSAMTIY